jgi:hypothetical protein
MPNNANENYGYDEPIQQVEAARGLWTATGVYNNTKSKLSSKSSEKGKKDPYSVSIQTEYQNLISDADKYGVFISNDVKTKLSSNINSINKIEEEIKKSFDESLKKQDETKQILVDLKESISEILNLKKYDECILKSDEFLKLSDFQNARTCLQNAIYYTKSKRDDVLKKIEEINTLESKLKMSKWCSDIKYYIQAPNNNVLNRIVDTCYSLDFSKLDESAISDIRTLYSILPTNRKVNFIAAFLENSTFDSNKIKLGLL